MLRLLNAATVTSKFLPGDFVMDSLRPQCVSTSFVWFVCLVRLCDSFVWSIHYEGATAICLAPRARNVLSKVENGLVPARWHKGTIRFSSRRIRSYAVCWVYFSAALEPLSSEPMIELKGGAKLQC